MVSMKMLRAVRIGFVLLATIAVLAAAATGADYKVAKTWKLGGDGGWDYLTVDSDGHRLFIARATRVMVIDTESGRQVGEIPDTPGVHGVALVPDLGRGFTSNGREDTVRVFDLKTLALQQEVGESGIGPMRLCMTHSRNESLPSTAGATTPRLWMHPKVRSWANWTWAASRNLLQPTPRVRSG